MVKQELFLSQQRAQNTVEVAASKTDVNKAPVAASKTDANKAHVAASASALHVSNSSVKKSSGTQSEVKLAESKLIGAAVMEESQEEAIQPVIDLSAIISELTSANIALTAAKAELDQKVAVLSKALEENRDLPRQADREREAAQKLLA